MTNYIETKKGYYYKEYKTGMKKRISKTEYIKHKRKSERIPSSTLKLKTRGYANLGQIIQTLTNLYNTNFKQLCSEYNILNDYFIQCSPNDNTTDAMTSCTIYARVMFMIMSGNDPSDDTNPNVYIYWIDEDQTQVERSSHYLYIEPNMIYQMDLWYTREINTRDDEDVYHACLFHKINDDDIALWQAYGDDELCERPRHIMNINAFALQKALKEMVFHNEQTYISQIYEYLFQRPLEKGIHISSISITYSRIQ